MPGKFIPKITPSMFLPLAGALGILTTAGGYYAGRTTSEKENQQLREQAADPHHAMRVILSRQNTWRTQYHSAYPSSTLTVSNAEQLITGREGAWVSMFKPRFTGAATYILFKNTENGKTYLLQTIQERVINGQKMIVCEPPAGFYNGAYLSSMPHAVTEDAEREIEKCFRLKQPCSSTEAYKLAKQKYHGGALTKAPYVEDPSLWQTSYRETLEETGLDITALESNPNFSVTRKLYDEIDVQTAYVSIRLVHISGKQIPTLAKLEGDEVIAAEWIPLEDFDLAHQQVKTTSKGLLPIKPEILPFTKSIVSQEANSSQKMKLK